MASVWFSLLVHPKKCLKVNKWEITVMKDNSSFSENGLGYGQFDKNCGRYSKVTVLALYHTLFEIK